MWERGQLCWVGCKSWKKTGFPVPRKLLVQLRKAFPVSHPRFLLGAQIPLPFRRGGSDISGFIRLGSPAIYPLAQETTFMQVSEQQGWALPMHAPYYISPQKNDIPPATLGALLPAAWIPRELLDWPCLAAEAADTDKVCSREEPALLSLCMVIFRLSHLGERQRWVQVLPHQPPAQLKPLCTTRAGRVQGEG